MSRRTRALAFLAAAIVCAALAATVAGRYRSRVEARYGPLRPVVVAVAELPAGKPIGVERGADRPGGAAGPGELRPARGAESGPRTRWVARRAPRSRRARTCSAPSSRCRSPTRRAHPGVGAGAAAGRGRRGGGAGPHRRRGGARGRPRRRRRRPPGRARPRRRAYIAASGVKLLALQSPTGPGEGWSATLAVTERAGARTDRRAERRAGDPPAAAGVIRRSACRAGTCFPDGSRNSGVERRTAAPPAPL